MTSNANKNFPKATRVSASEMHGHAPAAAKDTWIFNAEATSTLLIAAYVPYYLLGIMDNWIWFALGFHAGGAFAPFWIPVNAITCLIACYPLPVFVMWVLSHIGKLGFIVYPSRYLPASFGK